MKYFIICFILYFALIKSSSIKGNVVAKEVESFDVSTLNKRIVYVTKDDEYNLHIKNGDDDKIIISSEYKLSNPSISSDGNNITFTGINLLNENRVCMSILNGTEEYCSDIYWYNFDSDTINNVTDNFDGNSYISSISGNGRYVVFESSSSNVTGDYIYRCKTYQNDIDRSCSNIYKLDLINKKYTLISKKDLSGNGDSMEPSINYSGDSVVFRSLAPFFNDVKYCYNQYYDTYSYCSVIYLHRDNKLSMISDFKYDSYNGYISSMSEVVSFDSYSTMSLFEYHYQNSTFLYDIVNGKVDVINRSPNRVINNVMLSSNGKFNISISRATNIADSHSFMDNLIVTNVITNKSVIVENDTVFDVKDGVIVEDTIYMLRNSEIVEIKLNTSAPTINNSKDLTIIQGSNYNLLKYITVDDDLDDNVSVYISDYGGFDGGKPGKYSITIKAVDSNMNSAYYTYDVIVVERDIVAPEFVGDDYYKIDINDKYFRLSDFISVYDDIDDKVSYFVESGSVDITKAGKYKLLLKCSDSSSNVSYMNVTIEVIDNSSSFLKVMCGIGVVVVFVVYIVFLKKK